VKTTLTFPSPVQKIEFEGRSFYLKRDDLIHSDFSGNKARKFYYYLTNNFPQIKKIVSYGSNQSNAMYSLSVLARMKGWECEYYVDHISDYLRKNPQGNFRMALENGMVIREHGVEDRGALGEDNILFIEEGGRQKEAEGGIGMLAEESAVWQQKEGIEKLNIFLPSGTGTTALFLQKNLSPLMSHTSLKAIVFTTPCVGDGAYLKKQFFQLEKDEAFHPKILDTPKKYHFGKLYRDSYKIWLKLRQTTGVEFDLLYDPKGWIALMSNLERLSGPILYIHQGGLIGNESMLPRYERKYKELTSENILQR
jgi:1-aminocyclopropane-1-carboxylate deaminase/D-cysteine desulfhydrase-like pyridoxal-dependent ACC family enzyme